MDETQIRIFADAIWEYILEKHLKPFLASSVSYYVASVTTAPSNGVIGVQRPFDTEVMLPYANNASSLTVGQPCTVLVFGDTSNQIVIGNIANL